MASASRWRYIGNAKTKVEVGLEIWRQKSAAAMLSALKMKLINHLKSYLVPNDERM